MKSLKTASQILEHYLGYRLSDIGLLEESILKAMRFYSKYKSDIAYEKWFQTALKMLNNGLK